MATVDVSFFAGHSSHEAMRVCLFFTFRDALSKNSETMKMFSRKKQQQNHESFSSSSSSLRQLFNFLTQRKEKKKKIKGESYGVNVNLSDTHSSFSKKKNSLNSVGGLVVAPKVSKISSKNLSPPPPIL